MKKIVSLALVSAMTLALLAGCGDKTVESPNPESSTPIVESNAPETQAPGGAFNLNINIASEPQTIDPALNSAVDGAIMIGHMFEGLYRWADSGEMVDGVQDCNLAELVPGQAESYEKVVNDDGTVTYTFKLRDGIKWSDGKPVTAGDFVYSWQRLATPATAADYCYMIDMVKGYAEINGGIPETDADGKVVLDEEGNPVIKEYADPTTLGVEAPDDSTFVVTLTYDCPYFLEICAFPAAFPVREDVVSADPEGWTHNVETYISNGAYTLTQWDHNSQIIMAKNENYYDFDKLGPDTLTFKLMDDNNAMLTGFNSGELDFIEDMPVDEIPSLLSSGDLRIVPYIGTYYVCYNVEKAPFDNPKVRQAFTLAIDAQYIVENVTQTGQVPASGFVPSGVAGKDGDFRAEGGDYWTPATDEEQYEKNCEQARQLLAEAGYPNGEGFPTVTYLYNTSDNHKKIGEALQQQWQSALGVEVKLENQEWAAFLETRKQGGYQIARNGWLADYSDPISFLDMWLTGGGNNDAQYSNKDYDAAINEAKSTADPYARMAAMHRAEDIIMGQDWALGPIYFYTQKYMLADGVKGMYYTPLGYFFFDRCTK
ncbi:MAG: peptide ABC transporter substrate-binding protein [Oscillospiraceae bacterium]|nr:peptide ABC transporter substrate-binding protein [Oscillospiraceae bacterium]